MVLDRPKRLPAIHRRSVPKAVNPVRFSPAIRRSTHRDSPVLKFRPALRAMAVQPAPAPVHPPAHPLFPARALQKPTGCLTLLPKTQPANGAAVRPNAGDGAKMARPSLLSAPPRPLAWRSDAACGRPLVWFYKSRPDLPEGLGKPPCGCPEYQEPAAGAGPALCR